MAGRRGRKSYTTDEMIALTEKKIADYTKEVKEQKVLLKRLKKKKMQEEAAALRQSEEATLQKISEFIQQTGKSAEEILSAIKPE